MPIDALSVLCAQLTRDLLAIAKFLFYTQIVYFTISNCIFNCYFLVIVLFEILEGSQIYSRGPTHLHVP